MPGGPGPPRGPKTDQQRHGDLEDQASQEVPEGRFGILLDLGSRLQGSPLHHQFHRSQDLLEDQHSTHQWQKKSRLRARHV
ncbi:hypothetical protein L596_022575 [Steinernema carpocapsae]|uniref:Uncharacterized protein n=1 Tax=Steinernema carpocapsae TaxID=34508 RepID=A0A4U5MM60_STECR|nr:hypothetical protein L596_022575 [Steinernema carpocapsae]